MSVPMFWTPEKVVEALQSWVAAHGRVPSMNDWRAVGYGHPSAQTVVERFGTWNVALATAGYPTRRCGARKLVGA